MKNKRLGFIFLSASMLFLGLILTNRALAGGTFPINEGEANVSEITLLTPTPRTVTAENHKNTETIINWQEILVGAAIGWLLSLFSVWVVDKLKEPNLTFEVGSVSKGIPGRKWRFIHIKIVNKGKRFGVFSVSPAFAAKALVKIGRKEFTGRWTSKAEPLINTPWGQIIDPNSVLVVPREDIQPSEKEENAVEVSIGMKYDGETEFYGFNNESYLSQPYLKNNKLKFGIGDHKGRVTVSVLGKNYYCEFIVHNKSKNRSGFWLEIA